jgi:hypothetical protein
MIVTIHPSDDYLRDLTAALKTLTAALKTCGTRHTDYHDATAATHLDTGGDRADCDCEDAKGATIVVTTHPNEKSEEQETYEVCSLCVLNTVPKIIGRHFYGIAEIKVYPVLVPASEPTNPFLIVSRLAAA